MIIVIMMSSHGDVSTLLVGWRVRAPTIYCEIGSAADNTLLHSPGLVAVTLPVGYETFPTIGWHRFFTTD